jgi:hypothetical protein
MSGFTEEIRLFLRSQAIAENEVFDASKLSSRRYKGAMNRVGKKFAIVQNPCYRGHFIRSNKGHCIQRDTSRIAFVKRHRQTAYVYIAGSRAEKLLKIGFSETPWDRGSYLNQMAYGDIRDWKLLYYANVAEAGRIEFAVHSALSEYEAPREWVREGTRQTSREIFRCSYITARRALLDAIGDSPNRQWQSKYVTRYAFYQYLKRNAFYQYLKRIEGSAGERD